MKDLRLSPYLIHYLLLVKEIDQSKSKIYPKSFKLSIWLGSNPSLTFINKNERMYKRKQKTSTQKETSNYQQK